MLGAVSRRLGGVALRAGQRSFSSPAPASNKANEEELMRMFYPAPDAARTAYLKKVNAIGEGLPLGEYPEIPIQDFELVEIERVKNLVQAEMPKNTDAIQTAVRAMFLEPHVRKMFIWESLPASDRVGYFLRETVKVPEESFSHYYDCMFRFYLKGPGAADNKTANLDPYLKAFEAELQQKEADELAPLIQSERELTDRQEAARLLDEAFARLEKKQLAA
eukprot:gnl/Hemi2/25163_TR8464_c0_g1_i1.p1 gnl/Hemi2/25163_TR8464_c0_g1~~gnl/Hemi2/25163_TR8464_c0_g1_i1.p1  ORF type:complete len:233 (-),score=96.04 gnl/Hemi2/25163_TR8464_c0_g1_i1:195-854(-)